MGKGFFHPKAILFLLLGGAAGAVLFLLGEMDDAPGLSFIGLAAGFLLMTRGVYHAGVIRRGYHIPIILCVFGVVAILFPVILLLDGEIQGPTIVIAGAAAGIAVISAAWARIRNIKK